LGEALRFPPALAVMLNLVRHPACPDPIPEAAGPLKQGQGDEAGDGGEVDENEKGAAPDGSGAFFMPCSMRCCFIWQASL
jgi:hypothetical protein